MRRFVLVSTAAALLTVGTADARQRQPAAPPAMMQGLLACRSITDPTQRLACYDRQTNAVAQAIEKKDLVVIDQEQASQAKREVFGYSVPSFAGLLGGGPLNQIDGVVAAAAQNGDGGWVVRLQDGSQWQQTDDTPVALEPRRGDKVVVKRGTLGSYFFKLGNQPSFKAKRVD